MKYRVVFNPEAKTDLLALYTYVADRDGETRALRYIERIEAECSSLVTFPHRGKVWSSLRPGLRILGFERSVAILFQVKADTVAILRILYGGRDLKKILGDE